jgi:DNA-binding response OmpR family regulator
MIKILLLEDDNILNELIRENLISLGFLVDSFYDGMEAYSAIETRNYDLLLLDVGVPSLNGFELLEHIRDMDLNTPTIFITSLSSVDDVEKGFGLGCSDYIKKPFDLKELTLRIENILKIHNINTISKKELKESVYYDFKGKKFIFDEEEIYITHKESLIFEYLYRHKNRVISIDEIISNIWSYEDTPSYATIRTYIKNLRKVLPKDMIKNFKGIGYKLEI